MRLVIPTFDQLDYEKKIDPQGQVFEHWTHFGQLHSAEDRPAVVINHGEIKMWYCRGQLHRDGAPAILEKYGAVQHWMHLGRMHRKDGPATIDGDVISWWWRGDRCETIESWARLSKCDPELFVKLKLEYG